MSTLELENIKHPDNSGDNIALASNGSITIDRKSTDGTIAEFRKDGTAVGSIGTVNGDLSVGTNGTALRFGQGLDAVLPYSHVTGAGTDGLQTLGWSSSRFKDLYLSNGVYLGGTGSANHLDDYEEGTWTPIFRDETTNNAITMSLVSGRSNYTKIGRTVYFTLNITRNDSTSYTGNLLIYGLPFTHANNGGVTVGSYWLDNASGDRTGTLYFPPNNTYFRLKDAYDANDYITSQQMTTGRPIYLSGTYQT